MSELIVMLTYNDFTVMNASEVFDRCKHSKAKYWGFKEQPLPLDEMKMLYGKMKAEGKTTFLEVVSYDEAEGLRCARMAVECGCDVLMGTRYFDSINTYCREHDIKYMPFVGHVEGRPSVLSGSVGDILAEAKSYIARGVYGIDLLSYRYNGDIAELHRVFRNEFPHRLCLAGSIDSFSKLDVVKEIAPWAFTIGSAFFDEKFCKGMSEQIDAVCDYVGGSK